MTGDLQTKESPYSLWRLQSHRKRKAMKVSPFHSKLGSVYHDESKCTEGNNIEARNRVNGTGGLPKCEHCKRL